MNGNCDREDTEPTRIERPNFSELPSLDELVRLAEGTDWLLIQVPTVETVEEGGKRSDRTREDRERIVLELGSRLPTHRAWDSGFLPDEGFLAAARHDEVGTPIPGMARFSVRRVVTEETLEDHLGLLTAAATEYRTLANALMRRLARQLQVDVSEFAADESWHRHKQTGQIEGQEGTAPTDGPWDYFFHGVDCAFGSSVTRVIVEARLGFGPICGEDLGVFDPAFFLKFIRTSLSHRPEFRPLEEALRDWYENACRALEFMERRGVLRHVSSEAVIGSGWVMAASEPLALGD